MADNAAALVMEWDQLIDEYARSLAERAKAIERAELMYQKLRAFVERVGKRLETTDPQIALPKVP